MSLSSSSFLESRCLTCFGSGLGPNAVSVHKRWVQRCTFNFANVDPVGRLFFCFASIVSSFSAKSWRQTITNPFKGTVATKKTSETTRKERPFPLRIAKSWLMASSHERRWTFPNVATRKCDEKPRTKSISLCGFSNWTGTPLSCGCCSVRRLVSFLYSWKEKKGSCVCVCVCVGKMKKKKNALLFTFGRVFAGLRMQVPCVENGRRRHAHFLLPWHEGRKRGKNWPGNIREQIKSREKRLASATIAYRSPLTRSPQGVKKKN